MLSGRSRTATGAFAKRLMRLSSSSWAKPAATRTARGTSRALSAMDDIMNSFIRGIPLAIGLVLGSVGAASAHAHLKTATPAADSTVVAAPSELRLGFTEGVNLKFTGVNVTGPAGALVSTGAAALAPGDDKVLVVPVSGPLAPGAYKVDWHALATDGHKTDGSYGFTVKP